MKYKVVIILFLGILILMLSGVTYSVFTSSALLDVEDQDLAKFIFETEMTDQIHLPLTNVTPGETIDYPFSVTNTKDGVTSNVTVSYTLTLKTFHFMPLTIEIYRVNENGEEKIMTCDETYGRNSQNEIVCNSNEIEMSHNVENKDDYILRITHPEEYNGSSYADLVDFIDLEISSVQKTEA